MLYQTHARVHLGNIHANLAGIRTRIGPDRRILFAVKANAYGHGAVRVARMVQDTAVADGFAVATVPEGLELRDAGITLPILKLSPTFATETAAAVAAGLTLTVADASHIHAAQSACVAEGVRARVHLKIDTGMGRIGCTPGEAPPLADLVERRSPNLRLAGVFTHLPSADDPDETEYTQQQVARFAAAVDDVQTAVGRDLEHVHAANSGAILAHESAWFTTVRPGIMAYGYLPDPRTPPTVRLAPGMTWVSRVSYLKRVAAGTTIGYGRTWTAPRETWIATVPVGYADGYPRRLSNRGRVLIGGHRYPVVGRVCMDQIMVDLGTDAHVRVGQEVVLVGSSGEQRLGADEVAALAETIPYEITSCIAPRVTRVYGAVPPAALTGGAHPEAPLSAADVGAL